MDPQLRKEKLLKKKNSFEESQLERLRFHPDVPPDFNWKAYILLNPDLEKKGINTEFLALRHFVKIGNKYSLPYKTNSIDFPTETDPTDDPVENEKLGGKRAVYTCISGEYDDLKTIKEYDPSWEYICFTNAKLNKVPEGWQIRKIPEILNGLDPVRKARAMKILTHIILPEYKETIWIDGSIQILTTPTKFLKSFVSDYDEIAISMHPDRDCIYQEKVACVKYSKDDPKILQKQVNVYQEEGYPENMGLVQTGMMFRRHTPDIISFCEMWWEQVIKFSKRDQMSFNYILWKFPQARSSTIKIKPLSSSLFFSKYFCIWTHKSSTALKQKERGEKKQNKNYINGIPAKTQDL